MRQDSWSLGTWGRIPVSMHWTVLLAFAWMYLVFMDVVLMLMSIPFVFLVLAVHELGHVIVLRRRRIAVTGVSLWGIHGEASYNEYAAKPGDAVAVAWGGVGAQAVLMLLAIAVTQLVPFPAVPFGAELATVMFVVLVKLNIFLMIVALLPIGPFDGHAAWQVIRRTRAKLKAKAPPKAKPARPAQPEMHLSDKEQQEFDAAAEKEAADLIKRLTGKSDTEHRG
jgi:stage IV sporulation protein FB